MALQLYLLCTRDESIPNCCRLTDRKIFASSFGWTHPKLIGRRSIFKRPDQYTSRLETGHKRGIRRHLMTANATNSTGIPEKRRLAPFPTKMLCRRDIVFAFLYCSSTRQTMNTTGGRVGRRQEWARWKKKIKPTNKQPKTEKEMRGKPLHERKKFSSNIKKKLMHVN